MQIPAGRCALKARYVFAVDRPPMADGFVTIDGGRIEAIGTNPPGDCPQIDLGDVALLPGLVNAHTHLEFSDLTHPLGEPGMPLTDWIRRVLEYRDRGDLPPAADRIARGIDESVRHGTTALGEIATTDWPPPRLASAAIDLMVFRELIAVTDNPAVTADALELAHEHLARAEKNRDWRPGLSPHAPYSVHPAVLTQIVALATDRHVPVAIHLAESPEEIEWLRSGRGPLAALLRQRVGGDALAPAAARRPLDVIHSALGPPQTLFIHGNYLDDEEIAALAERPDRTAVVYCPRTHTYFQHDEYPLAKLRRAGATVALGTDSRASNPDLSLLAEMRHVATKHPDVKPAAILKMGTLSGAVALGRDDEFGTLTPGKLANMAVVDLSGASAGEPYEMLLRTDGPVVATIFRGRLAHG